MSFGLIHYYIRYRPTFFFHSVVKEESKIKHEIENTTTERLLHIKNYSQKRARKITKCPSWFHKSLKNYSFVAILKIVT